MSFLIKDEEAWGKTRRHLVYDWNKLGIKFNGEPVNDETYLKAKVREFNSKIKTNNICKTIKSNNIFTKWHFGKFIYKMKNRMEIKCMYKTNIL